MSEGPTVHGIEHIGMTVPNMAEATRFFEQAFAAQHLYDLLSPDREGDVAPPSSVLTNMIGVEPGAAMLHIRMLRLGSGPNLELFCFSAPQQRPPAAPNDFGVGHLGILVDDLEGVAQRIVDAGGSMLDGPIDLPGLESGDGNRFWYARAPWGSLIELTSLSSPQAYYATTPQRRWLPESKPLP